MTKYKRIKRRSQKGGEWYNPATWFGTAATNTASTLEKAKQGVQSGLASLQSGLTSADTTLGNIAHDVTETAKSGFSSLAEGVSSLNPLSSSEQNSVPVSTSVHGGGRHRRRARSMKGGKGGLGLTYYAAPVFDLKVAEPNSWQYYENGTNQYSVKGGSRKRRGRKRRRTRRHRNIKI